MPHEATFTVTNIVVHKLDTVQRPLRRARVRQALVDVPFTAWTHKTRWAVALESPDTVNAGAIVVTRSRHTIIHIDFTQYAQRSYATETYSISCQDIAQSTQGNKVTMTTQMMRFAIPTFSCSNKIPSHKAHNKCHRTNTVATLAIKMCIRLLKLHLLQCHIQLPTII